MSNAIEDEVLCRRMCSVGDQAAALICDFVESGIHPDGARATIAMFLLHSIGLDVLDEKHRADLLLAAELGRGLDSEFTMKDATT